MKPKAKRNFGKTVAALLVAAAGAAYWLLAGDRTAKTKADDNLYTSVQEGPLVINILEAGSIKPREQIIIKSEVEGANAILYIVPEGTRVQKGQLLVELDVSTLADRRVEQDIAVQNTESSFINAKENLEVVKNQAESDVELVEVPLLQLTRLLDPDACDVKDGFELLHVVEAREQDLAAVFEADIHIAAFALRDKGDLVGVVFVGLLLELLEAALAQRLCDLSHHQIAVPRLIRDAL